MSKLMNSPVEQVRSNNLHWHYTINKQNLETLSKILNSNSFIDKFKYLFSNPSEFMISIRQYPFSLTKFFDVPYRTHQTIETSGSSQTTTIESGYELPIGNVKNSGLYGLDITTNEFRYGKRRLGKFLFARYFNDYLDFEPYTEIQVYLPYLQMVNLPVNEVMGCEIAFDYALDLDTGLCTCYITNETKSYVMMQVSGKISVDIPINSTNQYEVTRNNLSNIFKTAVGVGAFAGGLVSKSFGVGLLTSATLGAVSGNQEHAQRGGSSGGVDNLYSPTSIYVIIKRHKRVMSTNELYRFRSLRGYPCGKILQIGTLSGFNIITQIHLERFISDNITSDELGEIETLLSNGVIF